MPNKNSVRVEMENGLAFCQAVLKQEPASGL
jgi:hypothetical protein